MGYNSTVKHFVSRLAAGQLWVASTSYAADDIVVYLDTAYRALTAHTSSASFETDFRAGRWLTISGNQAVNYILNPRAVVDTAGWSTYADAAGAQPVDGTGGSPSVAWVRSTNTPLRGGADFNFSTPGALNVQGQGVSYDYVIDAADQAKVLTISFDYEFLSGTYTTGDLAVYVIEDPTGTPVIIQPAGYQIQAATAGTKMRFIATYQTGRFASTSRLCIHVATTSTSAYMIAIENVTISPQVLQYGAPVTDWQSYTPSVLDGSTNRDSEFSSRVGEWRRVGDSVELRIRLNRNSSASSGAGGITYVTIPNGLSVYISAPSAPSGTYWTSADINFQGVIQKDSSGLQIIQALETVARVYNNTNFPASSAHAIYATVKIQGFSSTVQMSNDTDTRVVAARAILGTNQSVASGGALKLIQLSSAPVDTHGGFTLGASAKYTIPVSGIYAIAAGIQWAGNATNVRIGAVFVDGVEIRRQTLGNLVGTQPTYSSIAGITVSLNAGQTVELYGFQDSGVALNAEATNNTFLSIQRLSGPSAIAASETVNARYSITAGVATSPSQPVNFASREYDSHGAVTTGTNWRFIAPISGKYVVSSVMYLASGSANYDLYKNGSYYSSMTGIGTTNNGSNQTLHLNAGEFIDLRAGTAVTTGSFGGAAFVCIDRVGN